LTLTGEENHVLYKIDKVDDDKLVVSQVKDKVKNFLTNPLNDPSLPEKEVKEIEGLGAYPVSKGVISLQNDRGTSYRAYIAVQNELMKAVNELRDEFSQSHYGCKQDIVKKAIPSNISEAEPKDIGKRR